LPTKVRRFPASRYRLLARNRLATTKGNRTSATETTVIAAITPKDAKETVNADPAITEREESFVVIAKTDRLEATETARSVATVSIREPGTA
jgi:hypothetical protein